MVKATISTFIFCLVLNFYTCAQKGIQGEGPVVEKSVSVSPFSGIRNSLSASVHLSRGAQKDILMKGQANILDNIELSVKNGHLHIKNKKNVRRSGKVEIYITMPSIDNLSVSGSGHIRSQDHFADLKDLTLAISGSGDILVAVNARKVDAQISGSGNVSVSGRSQDLEVRVSGSGNVRADDLQVTHCNVSISGSGDVNVHVDKSLDVQIAGSGDVRYQGSVDKISSKIVGSGDVRSSQ